MKRLREGGRLKLQRTLSDDLEDEDMDKLLSDAGIPEDVLQDMSREEKRSNCNDILASNAEPKNQTTEKENTDTEENEQDLIFDEVHETKEKSKKGKRKLKKLSLHSKTDIQENVDQPDTKSDSANAKDEGKDTASVEANEETQPPIRKLKRGKKSRFKVSESPKNDDDAKTDDVCDVDLVLAPNTERSPTLQPSPIRLSEQKQVISESEMSSSPEDPSKVIFAPPDFRQRKIGIVRFTPDGVMNPSAYTQVIKLMFDIYIRRLRMATARRRHKDKEKWGDPVRCGAHSKNSLRKDSREDEENNIEAEDRTKRYATRSLYRNSTGVDFELETEASWFENKEEKWNIRSSKSKKDELSSRNEREMDLDFHLSANPISHSKVKQYDDALSDSNSSNEKEDSDYDPHAKRQKKNRTSKRQNQRKFPLKLVGKKKPSSQKKQTLELTSSKNDSRQDKGNNTEAGDRTTRYAARKLHGNNTGSELEMEPEDRRVRSKEEKWNVRSSKRKMEEEPSCLNEVEVEEMETEGRKIRKKEEKWNIRPGKGKREEDPSYIEEEAEEMETEERRIESKKEKMTMRSSRPKMDDEFSCIIEEEAEEIQSDVGRVYRKEVKSMDVATHSPASRISNSKRKQFDAVIDSSSESRESDYDPSPKHQKKHQSSPDQVTEYLRLGDESKASTRKEQTEELLTLNDEAEVIKDSSSHPSDSKEYQGKENTVSGLLDKGEANNIDDKPAEEAVKKSSDSELEWLTKSKQPKPRKGKSYSKVSQKKRQNRKEMSETGKISSKKKKINSDVTWIDIESKQNPDASESKKADPYDISSGSEEEASKDSTSDLLSGKSSKTIKSSSQDSRRDVSGTSKGPSQSPPEVVSSPEDTLDPFLTVNDAVPDSQSSGFLLNSNGDMYCTQIDKDLRKQRSLKSKEKSQMRPVTKNKASLSETQLLKTKKDGGKKGKKKSEVVKDKAHGGRTVLSKDSPDLKRKKQTKLESFADGPLQVTIRDNDGDYNFSISKQYTPPPKEQQKSEAQKFSSSSESSNEEFTVENRREGKHTKQEDGKSTSEASPVQRSISYASAIKQREDDVLTINENIGRSSRLQKDLQENTGKAILEESDDEDEVPSPEKGTCPICGNEFLARNLEVHASSCSDFAVEQESKAPCMICQEEFALDVLKRHQASCIDRRGGREARKRGKGASVVSTRSRRRVVEEEESPVSSGDDYGELHIEPAD